MNEWPNEYLLGLVHAVPALLGECAQAVPLVADLLTSTIKMNE